MPEEEGSGGGSPLLASTFPGLQDGKHFGDLGAKPISLQT